ncbi:MAG TPA: inositol monophosphatase [Opitutaceae bacterium]|nr:inositol monophosphatase [Opitutaceae bacterium]
MPASIDWTVMPKRADLIALRIKAGRKAVLAQTGRLIRGLGKAKSHWKSDGTRVTAVDLAISHAIFRDLRKTFPEDEFFSEELYQPTGPVDLKQRFAWILDPVDGTNNYALGMPNCAISLALMENGTPIYGFIYDLARRVLLQGGPSYGAWDGKRRVRVRRQKPDDHCTVAYHSPYQKHLAPTVLPIFSHFKTRGLGSSALHLAYVAAGMMDAVLDQNVKVWDIAGAYPICRAAGGEVHFMNGELFPLKTFDLNMGRIHYFAGNKAICAKLKRLLKA